jgi:hypothetical protein
MTISAKLEATGPTTSECKVGEIFSEMENGIQCSWNLHDIIGKIHVAFQTKKPGNVPLPASFHNC